MELLEAPLSAVSELLAKPRRCALKLIGSGDRQALDCESVLALLESYDLLVLHGFNFNAESFEDFGLMLFSDAFRHHNRARRRLTTSSITDILPADGSHRLPHIERGYAPGIPDLVVFYCDNPASEGGFTTFQHGSEVFRHLSQPAKRFFVTAKLRWTLRVRRAVWSRVLGVRSPEEAKAVLAKRISRYIRRDVGEHVNYAFVDSDLLVEFVTPAIRPHYASAEPMFINGSLAYLQDIHAGKEQAGMLTLAQGETVPRSWLEAALAATESCTLALALRQGDVVLVNNHVVLHGRTKFSDPARRILVQLGMRRESAWRSNA